MVMDAGFAKLPELACPPTVSRNPLLPVAPAVSITVTVIQVIPLCPVTGVNVRARLVPAPENVRFAFGTRTWFDETPETTRLATAVSASPTVKGIGGVAVLTGVV